MSDYRITVKVQNNNILSLIEAKGYKSARDFCKKTKYCYTILMKLINMKEIPLRKDGKIRDSVFKLMDILQCLPEELFSSTQMETALESNRAYHNVSEAEAMFMLNCQQEPLLLEDQVDSDRLPDKVNEVLELLTPREAKLLRTRFGLDGEEPKTLRETGKKFDVCAQRIRDIEVKALRKLRHISRASLLEDYK